MNDGLLLEDFIKRRDEAAFEALTKLHGPMVLGVCKRVLGDHHDAEEAFQATFLVLSRKANSIMPRNRVGNWLYGVAYRTALKAKALRNLRRTREVQEQNAPEPALIPPATWQEIAPLIDHELNSLPEKYRLPVVLCDLEGRSHKEVAHELGCPEGTLSGRLMRARNLLAKRLSRQGVALSVGAMTVLITQNAASAAVPAAVIAPVIQAAPLFAIQQTATLSAIAPQVAEIANGVVKSMFYSTVKQTTLGLALAASVSIGTIGLLLNSVASEPNAKAPEANVAEPMNDVTYHYAGTVVDEQGVPAAGAKLWIYSMYKSSPREPLAISNDQGEFEFSCKTSDFSDDRLPQAVKTAMVIAAKEGHGLAASASIYFESKGQLLSEFPPAARLKFDARWVNTSNVLKFTADDAPIHGRICSSPSCLLQASACRVWSRNIRGSRGCWGGCASSAGGRDTRWLR